MILQPGDKVIFESVDVQLQPIDIFDIEQPLEDPITGRRFTNEAYFQCWGVTTRTLQTQDGAYHAGSETVAICIDENNEVIILLPEQIRKA